MILTNPRQSPFLAATQTSLPESNADVLCAGHRSGHHVLARDCVSRRHFHRRDRAAGIPAAFSGVGLGRARAGGHLDLDHRDLPRGAEEGRTRRQRTSPRSASPTSARPPWCGTAPPARPCIAPSSGRTAAPPTSARRLKSEGHEPAISAKTGLIIDPYFSGTKVAWILDHVPGARERAERGELMFGTVDCYLLWRLTGGKVHATDATNASRTLLFNIHTGQWDDELLKILRVPRSMLPEVKDSSAKFGDSVAELFGGSHRDCRHRRRPAGRDDWAGLLLARHDQVDLRHRLFRAAQHRHDAGRFEEQAAHHHRLSARRQTHLRAGRLDLRRRRRGAMAARRPRDHQAGERERPARRPVRFRPKRLSGAGLRRPRRALLESARARRAVRPHPQHRPRRARACRAGKRLLPDLRSQGGDACRLAGREGRQSCCASTAA